jgi:hypothetical protein
LVSVSSNGLLGDPLTTIQLLGLTGRSFAPSSAELSSGLWVVLVDRESIAVEFTRLFVGLTSPRHGTLLIDGQAPRCWPEVRRNTASVLEREQLGLAKTTGDAVAAVAGLRGISLDAVSVLNLLGIEALATRATRSLTANESRQAATALALAQSNARAAIFLEPLVALNRAQISQFLQHAQLLAQTACVLFVTSSLHDAQLLGGPHAQLTARGWSMFTGNPFESTLLRVHVEGPNLRPLASAVALHFPIESMCLQARDQGHEILELVGKPSEVTTGKLVPLARQTRTLISRLFVEGIGSPPLEISAPHNVAKSYSESTARARFEFRTAVLGISGRCQWHLVSRTLLSVRGCAILLGEASIAAFYASLQRSRAGSWATYEALVFLGTVLMPIWSLIFCRIMYADTALRSGVEVLARYGAPRKLLALNRLLAISLLSGCLGAVSAFLALLCATSGWVPAHGELAPALWITGLGGAVYGAIVTALTDATRTYWAAWAFLLLDFFVGGTSKAISFPFPRAHMHNLLGSAHAVEISQGSSCMALGSLLCLALWLTIVRTDP